LDEYDVFQDTLPLDSKPEDGTCPKIIPFFPIVGVQGRLKEEMVESSKARANEAPLTIFSRVQIVVVVDSASHLGSRIVVDNLK
jgi:hypothetical protein